MRTESSTKSISDREFIALAALLTSLVAMSIDAMLPALGQIGRDLGAPSPNDTQLVISALFLGLAIAQMFFGPLSDSWGRKRTIYLGLSIFMIGNVVSVLATDFQTMLLGRVLQGIGAAGPKIVAVAAIRDRFKGAAMARIMSNVMALFIVVPAVAPALGQGVMAITDWRGIFVFFSIQGVVAFLWFGFRQPETLPLNRRLPFSLPRVSRAIAETVRNRTAFGFTLAAGLTFGAFLGYLNSAQQIFQVMYGVGPWFPAYFGGLALSVGLASIVNGRLVERVGMFPLSLRALIVLALLSTAFALVSLSFGGHPPLPVFVCYLVLAFLCLGVLFGNFNALAMEPLGHIAGTAAAVIASLSTMVSLAFGLLIGRAFDGTILPLVYGFAGLASVSVPILLWVKAGTREQNGSGTFDVPAQIAGDRHLARQHRSRLR